MKAKTGYAQGTCPVCSRLHVHKRPVDNVVCGCFRFCPLCNPPYSVPMTPFIPDLTPATYRNEDAHNVKGGTAESSEQSIEILYVCNNHSPPYYSKQKPVEVHLK